MAPLAIDEPDKAGNGPAWKHLGEKHEKAVEEPRHDHVFAAHGFDVGNMRGCLGCHAGVLPLLAEPLISYVGAAAGVAAVCSVVVGKGGAGSCAPALAAQRIATKRSMSMQRAIAFKS